MGVRDASMLGIHQQGRRRDDGENVDSRDIEQER